VGVPVLHAWTVVFGITVGANINVSVSSEKADAHTAMTPELSSSSSARLSSAELVVVPKLARAEADLSASAIAMRAQIYQNSILIMIFISSRPYIFARFPAIGLTL
jgi:hypothetical protein